MKRKYWTRSELIVAFYQYCITPFGRIHRRNPDIVAVAKRLGRTADALAMKMCNFASFDPAHRARQVAGLHHAAHGDRSIWDEFRGNWDSLLDTYHKESERLALPDITETEPLPAYSRLPEVTEIQGRVRIRIAQAFFRSCIIANYNSLCAVCQISDARLLNASHIIPWSIDEKRRADPENGLLLCALHDRAFDRGLFTLDQDYRVVLSTGLKTQTNSDVHRCAFLKREGRQILLPDRFAPAQSALEYHRNNIFDGGDGPPQCQ